MSSSLTEFYVDPDDSGSLQTGDVTICFSTRQAGVDANETATGLLRFFRFRGAF